jgi:hypothetical protein
MTKYTVMLCWSDPTIELEANSEADAIAMAHKIFSEEWQKHVLPNLTAWETPPERQYRPAKSFLDEDLTRG